MADLSVFAQVGCDPPALSLIGRWRTPRWMAKMPSTKSPPQARGGTSKSPVVRLPYHRRGGPSFSRLPPVTPDRGSQRVQAEALPKRPLSLRQRQEVRALLLGQGLRVAGGRGRDDLQVHARVSRSTRSSGQLRQAFVEKHGREPGPDDPLFPDLPHPERLEAIMVDDMKAAGLDPAFIHAFERTGLLVTQQNQHLIPEEDLAEWDAAIEEYEAKYRKPNG